MNIVYSLTITFLPRISLTLNLPYLLPTKPFKSPNLFTFIRHLQLISGPYCVPLLSSHLSFHTILTLLLLSLYLSPAVFSSGFSNPCRYVPRIISRTGLGHPRMMSFHHCGCSWSIADGHLSPADDQSPSLLTVGHRDPLSPLLPPFFCVFISTLLALHILRLLDIPPLTSPRLCRAGTVGTRPKA